MTAKAVARVRKANERRAYHSTLVPGVPTIAESGVPGYESTGKTGIFAPAKTPAAIINRLNQEIARFLGQPDVKSKLLSMGSDVVASTPEEFSVRMKSEMVRMGKVIKDANIRAE